MSNLSIRILYFDGQYITLFYDLRCHDMPILCAIEDLLSNTVMMSIDEFGKHLYTGLYISCL